MKKILSVLILLSALYQTVIAKEAILKLDTGGHTGLIKDVIVTQSGDIITASYDKTIRVWDSTTGREKRKILGQIGKGSQGMIYAIALSPDEKWLAVGGYLAGEERSDMGAIRIYNYPTGELTKVLKSHTNAVLDLAFDRVGQHLISGSGDTTAKIWDTTDNFSLKDTITFHTNAVSAVKIIKKGENYLAITAGYDKQIALYDVEKRKILKSKKSNHRLKDLATASNLFGGRIAVSGGGKEIYIYDFNLKLIKKIKSEIVPAGLAYSTDEKLLIAGSATNPHNTNIYQSKNNYRKKSTFKKHTNATIAVAFLNNATAISAGGNNEIYLWNSQTAKVNNKIEGVGARIWSVGVKGDMIGWGNVFDVKGDGYKKQSSIQKALNLTTLQVNSEKQKTKGLKRIATRSGKYSLTHTSGGDYGYSDATLILKKGKKKITKITKDTTNGYRHNCYGFYKDYIISGGGNGSLKIYNFKGKEIANLVGHTGDVWSIALDGDRLVSGGDGQTIKVWDLSRLRKSSDGEQIEPQLNIFVSKVNEWVIWSKSGYYNASAEGDKYIGYHINQGTDKEAYFVSSDKYADTYYRPDIIDAIIAGSSEKRAIESSSTRVATVDVASSLPPMLSLLSPSTLSTDSSRIIVKFNMQSSAEVEQLIVTRNGQSLSSRGLEQTRDGTRSMIEVDLEDGENIISIRAKNKFALSDELLVTATKTSQSETLYKPTLYLLTVGVSQYQNKEYNLKSADKDAKSIAEMFAQQEGKLYKKVVAKSLLNEQATKDNILDALDWIERETTQRDVVILFTAGHGQNDDKGNYYFLSHDADAQKLRRTAIKWTEIQDTITSLPSKVILMADTCHSGNIMGKGHRRDITGAIKSIINSGTGTIVMTASTGRGYSIEDDAWGHGAFTKAILEGLGEGKADYNNNDTIAIKEIDLYVTDRVKELTEGRQKPTTIIPQSVPDFAVGVR